MTAVTDDGNPIEQLTTKIARFQAGAAVDFSSDRDDEIGDLYAAVGDLADSLRVRDGDGNGGDADGDGGDAARVSRQEYERQRSLLDSIFEHIPVNLYVKDREGRHVRTSTPHLREEYEDVDEEWFVGKTDPEIYPDELAEESYDDDMAVIETGEPILGKVERNPVDDEWIRTSKAPWRDDDGEIRGLIGVSEYVTERREQERRLEAIVENTTNPIYVKDRDGVYQFVNEAAAALFGLDPEEVVGRTDGELFDPDSVADVRAGDRRVLDDGERVTTETTTTIDGERLVFIDDKYPYRDERGDVVGVMGISQDITERKARERELRETKQRLELALEGTNTGIWEWDPETDEVVWSETLEGILGIEPGEFEGTLAAFEERVHPDDLDRVESAFERALDEDELYHAEFRMRHEDGSWRWIESRGCLVDGENGERMIGIRQDVTGRKARERELERTTDLLARAEEMADIGGWAVDLSGDGPGEVEWTDKLFDVLGVARETEGLTDEVFEYFHSDDREEHRATVERAIEAGERWDEELRLTPTETRQRWVRSIGEPVVEDGEVVELRGSVQEITGRKARERELRETNERLDGIIEASPDAIVALDLDGTVELWNPAAEEIFGWSAEEVLGEPIPFVPEELTDEYEAFRERLADGESIAGVETERRRKDDTSIDVDLSAAPLRDEDGEVIGIMGVLEDVTERKQYERELERNRHLLEQSHRLTRVGAWEFQVADGEPTDLFWTDETYRIHDLPVGADVSLDEAIEHYHPDDREQIDDAVERAIRDGEPYDEEARLITAEGDERWVRAIGDPVVEDGEVVAVRGSIQDVTGRREREAEFERTSELLEQAGRLAGVGGWEVDFRTDPPTTEWTDELYRIHNLPVGTDVSPDEAIDLFHPEERARAQEFNERLAETGESYDTELRFDATDDDGTQRWVRAIGEAVESDGEVVKLRGTVQEITERKERERELRETKERMQKFVETSPVGVFATDPDGVVTLWNDAMAEIFGWTAGEVLGEPYPTVPDAVSEKQREIRRRVLSGESFSGVELERETRDGDRIDVSLSTNAIRDGSGEVSEIVGYIEDITDRKERERELRETKRHLELALEGTNTGVWEWDPETGELDWNDAQQRLFGLDPGKFEGTFEAFRRRTHPDDLPRVEAALERALERDEIYQAEFRMRHEDGGWIWVGGRGRVVEDERGRRIIGINNDITDRKERERQLAEYKEYTDDVLDGIDDVFYVVDDEGDVTRWNESLAEATGYADDEIADMSALEFFPDEHRPRVAEAITEVFETGAARIEAAFRRRDGERAPYEFVATRLEDPDGNVVLTGIGRDITERRERERQLREREQRLDRYKTFTEDVLDAIDDVFYLVDEDWQLQRWNESLADVTGYADEAIADMTAGDFFGDDDAARVEAALADIENRVGEPLEATIRTEDGETVPYEFVANSLRDPDGNRVVAGIGRDISERKRHERELERTRDMLQQAGRIAGIGGWELDLRADPPSMEWTDELYRLHDLPPETEIDVETAVEFYHPNDRERIRELFDHAVATGEGYDMEVRLQTSDAETRWMRAIGEPVREDGEVVAVRGSIQDITDRKERELALESLHETTRGLLGTETDAEVADLVVAAATAVLDTDAVAVYLLDERSNRLEPAAATDEFAALCGDDGVGAGDGDSPLWDAFVTGEARVVEGSASGDGAPFGPDCPSGLLIPIGDHGVFAVPSRTAAVSDETRRLAETLAATTEAALDRLESEASLRERDAELEAQNERLKRQVQITEIIRRIDRSLIRAGSRAEIESAVCDGLADAEDVAFAWIGSLDAAGGRVEPRAWAGTGGEYLDAVSLATDESSPEPAAATAAGGESTVVGNVVEGLKRDPWRKDALAADFHSVLSVPLTYEGYVYGVLAVYATEPGAFGDLERDVFEELGTNIANSINAVETQRALHADTLVELRLALDSDETFLGRIARDADCEVTYEGLATHADEESRLFFTATAAPDDVAAVLADLVSVTDYRRVSEGDDAALYEVTVTGETLPSRLVPHGATPRSIDATPDETNVVVDVPPSVDVREFVEMLRETFPSVELVARRSVERTAQTRQELTASLFEALTDRQREVLRTAYYAGFFEWPRESTGEDIADMLDVTQPTVNRHLRVAQQRLLDQLFDETPTTAVSD